MSSQLQKHTDMGNRWNDTPSTNKELLDQIAGDLDGMQQTIANIVARSGTAQKNMDILRKQLEICINQIMIINEDNNGGNK